MNLADRFFYSPSLLSFRLRTIFVCKAVLCATLFLQSNLAVSQEVNAIKRWLNEGIAANSDYWSAELKKLSASEVKKEAVDNFYRSVFGNDCVVSALASLLERHGYETKVLLLMENAAKTSASSSTAVEVKGAVLALLSRMMALGRVRINQELQRSAIEFHLALLNIMPKDVCGRYSSTGLGLAEYGDYVFSVDDKVFVRAFQAYLAAVVAEAEGTPKAKILSDAELKAVAPLFVRNVASKARSRDNYTQLKPYLDNP